MRASVGLRVVFVGITVSSGLLGALPARAEVSPREGLDVSPARQDRGLRLGVSASPVAAQEVTSKITTPEGSPVFDYFVGGRADASLQIGVGLYSEIVLAAFASPTVSETAAGKLMPVGGRVAFRHDVAAPVFSELGLGIGYLFVPEETPAEQYVYVPAASMFYAPEITPVGVRLGPNDEVELGLRLGVLFSRQDDTQGSLFGVTYVTESLYAGYLFSL